MTINSLSNESIEFVCIAGLNICQDYPVTLDEKMKDYPVTLGEKTKQNTVPQNSVKHYFCAVYIWNIFPSSIPF